MNRPKPFKCVSWIVCLISATTIPTFAQDTARIIDGDTVEQGGITYRIHGIVAPEFGQKCGRSPCGKLAIEAMAVLAEGKRLQCESLNEDGYGRTIARCYADGLNIGAEMVQFGQA